TAAWACWSFSEERPTSSGFAVGNSPAGRIVGRSRAAQTATSTNFGIFTAGTSYNCVEARNQDDGLRAPKCPSAYHRVRSLQMRWPESLPSSRSSPQPPPEQAGKHGCLVGDH